MAAVLKMWHTLGIFITLFVLTCAKEKAKPLALNEDNWKDMLEGEWMVKFYAPWCPACKSLAPTWDQLASWTEDLDFKVGTVDVTENPGLSGRFMVMALPTIFHVKDGEFRVYRGAREENELVSFVDDKKWKSLEPLPWYKSPTSIHMSGLSLFFKLSMYIRNMHTSMTEEYGIPVWGSYGIFAVATIVTGLLLGVLIVFLCDVMYPPQAPPRIPPSRYDPPWPKNQLPEDHKDTEGDVVEDDRPQMNAETQSVPAETSSESVRKRKAVLTTD